jgi:uncharacterized protein (TIGR03086 family)
MRTPDIAGVREHREGCIVTPEEQLERIVPSLNELVERMWHGQLEYATPCAKFTVHDVLNHMIVLGGTFAPMFRGEPVSEVIAPAVYGWVPAAEFTKSMDDLVAAVRSPGAMERTIDSPVGAVDGETFCRFVAFDGLVHGWDMATAIGATWNPPEDLVAEVDAFARVAISPEMRDGDTFAAETEPPPGATPMQRLAAFSGRSL